MGRKFALHPKITRRLYNTPAEEFLPKLVYKYP